MSNIVALNIVVNRAKDIQSHAMSLIQPSNLNVPTSVIVFADTIIKNLQAENDSMRRELVEIRAILSLYNTPAAETPMYPEVAGDSKRKFFLFLIDSYPELYAEIPTNQRVIGEKDFVVTDLFIGAYEEWSDNCEDK